MQRGKLYPNGQPPRPLSPVDLMRGVEPYMDFEAERANLGGLSMRSVDTATDTITYTYARGTVTVSLSTLFGYRVTKKG